MGLKDLTSRILKACFDVSNELGCGFIESVYERSLLIALHEEGLKAQSQVRQHVLFRGQLVGEFTPDIVVENQILLELKAVKALAPEHVAQVLNYLKSTGFSIGMLVNFGKMRLEYRRFNNRFEDLKPTNIDIGDLGI